MMYDHNFNMRV